MNLYDREIIRGYEALKRQALRACEQGQIEKTFSLIECLSRTVNQCNWMLHDEALSNMMDSLSRQMLTPKSCTPIPKRVVFYDQYGKYFILAQQYLNALVAAGYDVLYVLSDYVSANPSTFIVEDLRNNPHIQVEVVPLQWSYQQRAEHIQQLTLDFAPEKIFLHVKMFSVFNLVLPSLPRTIQNYYIDLQDHALWVKNHQLDFVLPYRIWGATIDIEQRGFRPEQVLLLPYFPIVRDVPFQGFPKEVEGKVVIFTGGEFYKTIDKTSSYWTLIVRLLKENPNAVVLYAIKGNDQFFAEQLQQLHEDYQSVQDRLIPIGFRTDINEVFAHCGIYLGTSPMSGGLMCQYAAYNSKPILQYYVPGLDANNETEQVISFNGNVSISFTDAEAFLAEAKHLIDDAAYRQQRGKEIHEALITEAQFNDLLARTIQTNTNQVPYTKQKINYAAFADWWMYLENNLFHSCRKYILSLLKRKKYIIMPLSALKARILQSHD